ncbi:MAG TPA: M23 family metallopeptidase [Pyrinomonadaceae bacterium]|nr:M23 family metallopeptidase [Pyrinomonadaceae bacterium]
MKKFALALVVVCAGLVVANATGLSPTFEHFAGKIADRFMFYVHVAQLYTREPDQKLAMPVQNVSKKAVANTWGAARGSDRLHQGQDIFAPRGTPIFSATEGYVARIGVNMLGGQTVSVIGAGGRIYYYAHLDSYAPLLKEGDFVTEETVLGFVGTTGNAAGTPPHLHFGVYAPGGAVNPLPMIEDRPSAADKKGEPGKRVTRKG